jgi:hypothetical protein
MFILSLIFISLQKSSNSTGVLASAKIILKNTFKDQRYTGEDLLFFVDVGVKGYEAFEEVLEVLDFDLVTLKICDV